jgi:ACS family hexuronate transporter-like MFS transporter
VSSHKLSGSQWRVLALLFFATTINYMDRIVFSVLLPVIRLDLHINPEQYGYLTGAFQAAYTAGFLALGKFIDRFGTRIGYAAAIAWWSLAAALHGFAGSFVSLGFWRAMLGLGEAGNFPAAVKATAEWFPKKDRAFATGCFNAGSNVASMVGPPIFFAVQKSFGWRTCFLITGGLGFVWLVFWWLLYHLPPNAQAEEAKEPAIGWAQALRYRETWGFTVAKFLSDPVWWFYLYWLPPYFFDVRKLDLQQIAWALPVIYLMADVGSVGGGWLSGYLMRRGWEVGKARKTTMLIFACMMPIGASAVLVSNPILAIALISVAVSAHQGWSANLFTTASDVFPNNAVASVAGIGGCFGGLGGFFFSAVIPGYVVQNFGYTPVFITMGFFHLIAWLFVHFWMKDLRRINS